MPSRLPIFGNSGIPIGNAGYRPRHPEDVPLPRNIRSHGLRHAVGKSLSRLSIPRISPHPPPEPIIILLSRHPVSSPHQVGNRFPIPPPTIRSHELAPISSL